MIKHNKTFKKSAKKHVKMQGVCRNWAKRLKNAYKIYQISESILTKIRDYDIIHKRRY